MTQRSAKPIAKTRLNLEMSASLKKKLDDMVERSGASSFTEVVRTALSFYDLVLEHDEAKGKIVFRYPDGTEEVIRLLKS